MNKGTIEHQGIVREIKPEAVKVEIRVGSACSSCHARGIRDLSETSEKLIEVRGPGREVRVGETVTVLLKERFGWLAVVLGYLVPFAVLLGTLFILADWTDNELVIGLGALTFLGFYYIGLYLVRARITKTIEFSLQ